MRRQFYALSTISLSALLGACASGTGMMQAKPFDQTALPAAIQVPVGNVVAMETVGVGMITYECKTKPNTTDQFEWVFVGPDAKLMDRSGKEVGKYYGPPATWQSSDGSKITATQLAVAPAPPGSIPLQLVKANTATGDGQMKGVSYIQRLATQGGAPPAKACDSASLRSKEVVKYQADYIFWRAI